MKPVLLAILFMIMSNDVVAKDAGVIKSDTCNIYSELESLQEALVKNDINYVAQLIKFPIKDSNIQFLAYSYEELERIYVDSIDSNAFRSRFNNIFPKEFIYHIERVEFRNIEEGKYSETTWKNTHDKNGKLSGGHRLYYQLENGIISFNFYTEYIEGDYKYETSLGYYFSFSNCKLIFIKSFIAG